MNTTTTVRSGLLPTWESFERDYVVAGFPLLFVVRPRPLVAVFLDENSARLGVRFHLGDAEVSPPSPLEELHVGAVVIEGIRHLEAWTDSRELFPNFFRLASEVAHEVANNDTPPSIALSDAIARWDALLTRSSILSEERQAGLFGELWLLVRLIAIMGGDSAVAAWVGPSGQAHDFRIENIEFEVKTTSRNRRIHTINGVGQLQPSLGCRLYLLSMQLTDAGAGGRTLGEAVEEVATLLDAAPSAKDRYRSALNDIGYKPSDAQFYTRRRRLRDAALLVPIVDGAPRVTTEAVSSLPSRFCPERIIRIAYDIDVTGLGVLDGEEEFHAVLPPAGSEVIA